MVLIKEYIYFGVITLDEDDQLKKKVSIHPKYYEKFQGLTLISTLLICDDPREKSS